MSWPLTAIAAEDGWPLILQINDFHFFDGLLARTLAFAGFALLVAPALWRLAISDRRLPPDVHTAVTLSGFVLVFVGSGLALNAVVLDALRPVSGSLGGRATRPELTLFWQGLTPILTATYYGRTWLGCVSALALALGVFVFRRRNNGAVGACVLGAFLFWTRLGHAADTTWLSAGFGAQLAHGGLILVWLAGLSLLALGRFSGAVEIRAHELTRFSRCAVRTLPLALLGGALRLFDLYRQNPGAWLNSVYGWAFALKLLSVGGLLATASRLRTWLNKNHTPLEVTAGTTAGTDGSTGMSAFDSVFTFEILLAAVILLLSALLSQLPLPLPLPSPEP
jgi:hypothetical protein